MPVTIYGDGSKYGDADAIYGRISAELAAAQASFIRETGLEVRVIDEQLNAYEVVNSVGNINAESFKPAAISNGHNDATSSYYWGYRGFADMVKLDNGTIVRVRIGNPTDYSDRQVYYQEVTDPSNASQWQSWSLLYSGIHFCAVVVADSASTYDVYHCKLNVGLCKNNSVLFATATDGARLDRGVRIAKGPESYSTLTLVITVPTDYPYDNKRVLDLYVTEDADNDQPEPHTHNFKWERNTIVLTENPADPETALMFRSFQLHASPRLAERGESITVTQISKPGAGDFGINTLQNPPILIRGFTGLAGRHIINLGGAFHASDGYVYLFYYELHTNEDFASIQSGPFFFWQRSKDGIHWSEPVLTGYQLPKFAGAFEYDHGGDTYLYLVANGSVVRRPMDSVEYVLDDYVPALQFEIPRDNQDATGSVLVANPDGVNDALRELSDRRIHIRPGLKTEDGNYEFKQFADFWVKRVTEEAQHEASRLTVEIGDVWVRLSEQMRDTFNIVGRTVYNDWSPGAPNESFAYFFANEAEPLQEDDDTFLKVSEGRCIWTGWKGHNPDFSFRFTASSINVLARFVNADNHMKFAFGGSLLTITNVIEGNEEEIFSGNIGATEKFRIQLKWSAVKVWADGALEVDLDIADNPDPVVEMGYVGWSTTASVMFIADFEFTDWEQDITSHDLVRYALAMGDYHDVIVGGPSNRQFALIWGPQTDIPTAADGLRQVLEAEKLELIWLDGLIQVGRFTSTESIRTLENEVISSAYREEAARRINLAIVDGNEHSWFEADSTDTRERGRQIVGYFDIPELMDQEAVTSRSIEEIRRGTAGQAPGGQIPLNFDVYRMDVITWVDNRGNSQKVRVEGIRVDINQSTTPYQREELDTSLVLE